MNVLGQSERNAHQHRIASYALKQEKAAGNPAACIGEDLLHTLLVGLDHLLDHLAADGAGLAGGQVAVVAVGQIDAHLPWCPSY